MLINPMIILLDNYSLQHLMNGRPIIHTLIGVNIPRNIAQLIGSQKAISVIIVVYEQIFTFSLAYISVNV